MNRVLPERLVRKLDDVPESGMGFHVVDIRLSDGRNIRAVTVLNGSEAQLPDGFEDVTSADMADVEPPKASRRAEKPH
jgi:hypothetical protein